MLSEEKLDLLRGIVQANDEGLEIEFESDIFDEKYILDDSNLKQALDAKIIYVKRIKE